MTVALELKPGQGRCENMREVQGDGVKPWRSQWSQRIEVRELFKECSGMIRGGVQRVACF
jgi:hypothetical protein